VAREEVRPERALAHELHIHPLVTLPLGHEPSGQALRGQATVDLPIDQPPAWQGVRHQISWAIEAESQTPSGPCLWRFPLLIASPPRLHITPTSCPAEVNLAAATSLTLVIPIADVMPGESIAGTITWKLNRAPRFLELRLICGRCRTTSHC